MRIMCWNGFSAFAEPTADKSVTNASQDEAKLTYIKLIRLRFASARQTAKVIAAHANAWKDAKACRAVVSNEGGLWRRPSQLCRLQFWHQCSSLASCKT